MHKQIIQKQYKPITRDEARRRDLAKAVRRVQEIFEMSKILNNITEEIIGYVLSDKGETENFYYRYLLDQIHRTHNSLDNMIDLGEGVLTDYKKDQKDLEDKGGA